MFKSLFYNKGYLEVTSLRSIIDISIQKASYFLPKTRPRSEILHIIKDHRHKYGIYIPFVRIIYGYSKDVSVIFPKWANNFSRDSEACKTMLNLVISVDEDVLKCLQQIPFLFLRA